MRSIRGSLLGGVSKIKPCPCRGAQAASYALRDCGPAPEPPVWHSSSCDLGIYDAAYTHSCAAAPNCTLPSDILGYLREDDLVVTPIEIKDSYAIVPQTPGLGVELDEEAAKKYRCA